MSTKELSRLEVMQRMQAKRLIQKEAAILLGLSIRQIKRLWQKYQKQDAQGLISKRRGQASNNRIDAGVSQKVLDLIKKKYADFGPTLAHEKVLEGFATKHQTNEISLKVFSNNQQNDQFRHFSLSKTKTPPKL